MSQEESTFQNRRDEESDPQEAEENNEKPDIPLFMEDKADSPHGDEQDEKDETEE
ncbi:MAG TPA: hypothetical protein VF604_08335 [Pyrinomonadaceae bacterium]|jgi:hypothetical protein